MKMFILGVLLMSSLVNAEEVKVEVKGMVCSMCAQGIQKKFKDVTAIEALDVDLDKKIVTLKIRDGESVPDSVIKKYITEAGYNVGRIERKE
jgi:copper chaperone CopZ